MASLRIGDLLKGQVGIGEKVRVQGWVRTRRDSKAGFSFIHLHDGSSFDPIQIVAPGELKNYQDEILHLTSGCAITANGTLVESRGKGQKVEIQAESIQVVGWVSDSETYPIQPKRHSFEYLREVAHLRPRTNTFGAMARVRHTLARAIHDYLHEKGFYWIHTPIITAADCEGAGELFRVSTLDLMHLPRTGGGQIDFSKDFFGKESFLTVSGQLNVEAYCLALSKVYTFGPTFRAENSNTSRHLSEFWMIEPEMAFADLDDNCRLAEDFLKSILKKLLEECEDDMAFFARHVDRGCLQRIQSMIESEFVRMDYGEAIRILGQAKQKFEFPVHWGTDLQSEHERYLTEKHVKAPVVVTDFPAEIKAFYMRLNDDQKTVAAVDVLVPGMGEIIGGSQREERLEVLENRIQEMGFDLQPYQWYLDLRRYGSVPHSGFGLGFERTVCYATGLANIRDAIPFPRTPHNVAF